MKPPRAVWVLDDRGYQTWTCDGWTLTLSPHSGKLSLDVHISEADPFLFRLEPPHLLRVEVDTLLRRKLAWRICAEATQLPHGVYP